MSSSPLHAVARATLAADQLARRSSSSTFGYRLLSTVDGTTAAYWREYGLGRLAARLEARRNRRRLVERVEELVAEFDVAVGDLEAAAIAAHRSAVEALRSEAVR